MHSGAAPTFLETGLTLDRSNEIQPRNQHPVKLDAFRVFFDAIEKQEHLIEVGPWAKKMRMIFSNSQFSTGIAETIRVISGQQGMKYIKDFIDSAVNPYSFKRREDGQELIGTWRGKVYVGMLAYRVSSYLMQTITSPLPFIADAPLETMAVAAEAYTSGNPVRWYQEIEKKSSALKHRQMDPALADYLNMREVQERSMAAKIGQAGMDPFVNIDKLSVAIGWEAVRRRKKAQFVGENVDEKVAELRARDYADQIVRQTQPTSEAMFRSPLYRNMDTTKQMFLQFTQPLNVIWNNIRYDVPQEWVNHNKGRAIGLIMAYVMSGLAIGMIKLVRGRGPDEDDDDEAKWAKFWMLAASSQFTESVPVVGSLLNGVVSTAVTGTPMIFNEQGLPAADALAKGLNRLSTSLRKGEGMNKKDIKFVLMSGFKGLGLMSGFPTLAFAEYYDMIERLVKKEDE